jgi:hypothetical protein
MTSAGICSSARAVRAAREPRAAVPDAAAPEKALGELLSRHVSSDA